MKKRLIWWLAFVAALVIGDRSAGFLLSELTSQSTFRFTRLYEGQIDADIVILGNSRGVNSFYQPDIAESLSKKVYNLSYNGIRIDMARVLFEDYLRLNRKPSLLIVEASMLTMAYPELIKEFKPYVTTSNSLGRKMKELYPKVFWAAQGSDLFRFNSETFLRSLYFINHEDQKWISDGLITNELKELAAGYDSKFDIDVKLLEDIAEIQKLCLEHKIAFKIVLCPYYPDYASGILNLEEWKARINARLQGVLISDYSSAIDSADCFADWVHLNKRGSKVFLGRLMNDNFFAP